MPFPHVFEPLRLRHRTLTSRITFGAHTTNMAEGGLPGERHIGYYRERALGGAGMIVIEPVPVHRTAVLTRGNFRHDDDAVVPHFRRLIDACRDANPDVVMIQQLYHVGQHGDAENSFAPNWSPSGLPSYHDADGSHAMTESEIEEVIAGFVATARRAQLAGFDGVELFAAYHALIDQFWTPWSNRRDDAWGGSLEGRMRFSCTILEQIRATCGEDFIVGLAVSVDTRSAPALTVDELAEIVAWHDARRLMDYVTCGTGSYFDFYPIIPVSLYEQQLGVPFAASLKRVVTNAVVQAESHIRTPAAAEAVLAAGQADLVSIVRGQIADPHMVAKARADRADEVRPCISCNQLCWGRRSRDYWISCLVNPSAGREFEWEGDRFEPATTPRSVLVVGGGPAGLETARVAAERGHRVTLYEARDAVGGQFRLAGLQPSRGQILDLLAWYGRSARNPRRGRAARRGGDRRGCGHRRVRPHHPRDRRRGRREPASNVRSPWSTACPVPSATTPSRSRTCWLAVRTSQGACSCSDDLNDWRGLGTALHLAEAGHDVTIVTSAPVMGGGTVPQCRRRPAPTAVRRGRRHHAPGHRRAVHGTAPMSTVRSTLTGAEEWIRGRHPGDRRDARSRRRPWPQSCGDAASPFEAIGDCVAPRRASLAFYEGRELARRL